MNQSKENKTSRRLTGLLKLCIAAGALLFIWYRVFHKESIRDVLQQFDLILQDDNKRLLMISVLLLMLVNWLLEAVKWRLLIQMIEPMGIIRSVEAVFTGLTVSFFTPNRVGEYAGRVMYLAPGNRIKGTLLTVVENLAQLAITLVLGAVALPLFLHNYAGTAYYIVLIVTIISICFAALVVLMFLRISTATISLGKVSFLRKYERFLLVAGMATPKMLLKILGYSLIRFLVFSGQYYILLLAFDVPVGYASSMLMIILTFFVMTVVPTFAFTDLGVRGAAGIFFFAYLTAHLSGVVYATLTLWLINLALPAAAGALLLAVISPQRKKAE